MPGERRLPMRTRASANPMQASGKLCLPMDCKRRHSIPMRLPSRAERQPPMSRRRAFRCGEMQFFENTKCTAYGKKL